MVTNWPDNNNKAKFRELIMPNKMERFTNDACIILAQSEDAKSLNHGIIEPEHMLLAMTRTPESQAYGILDEFDISESKLFAFLESLFKEMNLPPIENGLSLSDSTKKVLELAVDEARRHFHHQIDSLHMLLGIIRLNSPRINRIFAHFDVDSKVIREYIYTKFPKKKGCLEALSQLVLGKTGKRKNDE
jgi:ATP-dependent Clp protease ATP-binding subunit ClpA